MLEVVMLHCLVTAAPVSRFHYLAFQGHTNAFEARFLPVVLLNLRTETICGLTFPTTATSGIDK